MLTFFRRLLWDETAFVRYARALLLCFASGWTAYQINGVLDWKLVLSAFVGGLAGMLGAGEKNRQPDAEK